MLGHAASSAAQMLIAGCCLCVLAGCAVVTATGPDGKETMWIQPATTSLNLPSDRPQIVRSTTLGVSSRSQTVDVGLRNEEIVIAPAKCHAVLVVRTDEQARTAAKLARMVNRDCVVRRRQG